MGSSLLFVESEESRAIQVTFGDSVKRNVIGKGNINQISALILNDVRLVERLSANLISFNLVNCVIKALLYIFQKTSVKC